MDHHATSKRQLLGTSLAIAGGLTGLKLAVFVYTDSTAILASAADSFMDFLVSLVNFILVRSADMPADKNHAYGHGKIESLGGFLQSLVIGGAAIGVASLAFQRIARPQPINEPLAGVAVSVLAVFVSLWHIRNLRRSAAESGSKVMAAEYLHYASDILVYVGVIASLILYRVTGLSQWDPAVSLLIVVYLVKNVASIFNSSLAELLDEQIPPAELVKVEGIIRGYDPRVADFHELRTRKVGNTRFIEFHVVLRGVQRFDEAHAITEGLATALRSTYPGAVVTITSDPEGAPAHGRS